MHKGTTGIERTENMKPLLSLKVPLGASLLTQPGQILWSILLLAEVYSGWVWLALAMMLAGLGLIQPRPTEPLVSGNGKEETEAT